MKILGNEWQLPKPIRYEDYQLKEGSYVVAGAQLKCNKMKNALTKVELSVLYRGADTGYDIKAMDIDRKEENFCPSFGICTKSNEPCVLNNMAYVWNNPNEGLGYIVLKYNDVYKYITKSILRPSPTTITAYPLSMKSKIVCYHGGGVIEIKKMVRRNFLLLACLMMTRMDICRSSIQRLRF